MFDPYLRPLKDRVLAPFVRIVRGVHPTVLTGGSLVTGLGSAVAGYRGVWMAGFVLWVSCRVLDGLDGLLARATDRVTELGAVLDLVSDFIVYAAIPLALGLRPDAPAALLPWTAVLLATFYVNTVAWLAPSALLERRAAGAEGRSTSIVIPEGLVSGGETVVFFCLFFLLPAHQVALFATMAFLTGATVVQRVLWATRVFRTTTGDRR